MKIKYEKEIYNVENFEANEELFAKINGNQLSYKFKKIDDNHLQALNSESKVDIFIAEDKSNIYVGFNAKSFKFEKIDEEKSFNFIEEKNQNQDIIKSPMPGNIVKILVNDGDIVKEGTPIIIVEAMKMETTLYSSIAGIVKKIYIEEKSQVDSDNPLVLIEKE